jgi:hypothetical protein
MMFVYAISAEGSIKGDVKKKYFPDVLRRGCFFDIQPLFAAARLVARAWFGFSSCWEVLVLESSSFAFVPSVSVRL